MPKDIFHVYYLGTSSANSLYTTTDGKNWNRNNAKGLPTNLNVNDTAIEIINGIYYIGTVGHGLWTSTDGENWTHVKGGLGYDINVNEVPIKYDGVYYLSTFQDVSGVSNGLWTSTDGKNWNRNGATGIPEDEALQLKVVKIDGVYYLGAEGDGLYISK